MEMIFNYLVQAVFAQSGDQVNLLEPLPGGPETVTPGNLQSYVQTAFPIFLGVAVALAVIMISWGGLEYMLSKIPGAKAEGKDRIRSALWGLLLALVAWVILQEINSQITATKIFTP